MSIRKIVVLIAVFIVCMSGVAQDRTGRGPGGRWADQPHMGGTISAIRADAFDIQSQDGNTSVVKITPETQFRKDGAPAKISDFKIGDRVMAIGEQQKDGSLVARIIATGMPPSRQGAQGGRGATGGNSTQDLGKKFIMGEVKKVDETKLTVLRPDKVEQVIQVDESTSFRNEKGESITLADVKVGDHIGGPGELKNDVFVANMLHVGFEFRPHARPDRNQKPQAEQK